MFLTLTPDTNFADSGSQVDQVDFLSTVPSGLLLRPNTKISLHSASWKVIEGITIPTGSFSITVMGYKFDINFTGQTFQETPTGSSTSAGSLCADYLNDLIMTTLKNGPTLYSGLADNSELYPAYARFGGVGTVKSSLWTWDTTGKDFVFDLRYNGDADYDTQSTVMVSGNNAASNFLASAFDGVATSDYNSGSGYRYRMKPAVSKSADAWNDAGFYGIGTAFTTDGESDAGKGKVGQMVFKWSDASTSADKQALVGFCNSEFRPTLAQTQKGIVASIQIKTGVVPIFREVKPSTGFSAVISPATPPPATANGTYYKILLESNTAAGEKFKYYYSTDGNAYTEITMSTASPTDRYDTSLINIEPIMPCFKPYSGYDATALYGIDNWTCSLVPSKARKEEGADGYNWKWTNYPEDVSFAPGALSTVFDIKGFDEKNGAGKADGGVVNNVNTSTSGVYVDCPTLGIKSITSGVERNVIGTLPIGEMADGTNGMGSVNGLQFNQVYNMIYHDLENQQEREHNQLRIRLLDQNGTLLTNITNPAINLCIKPATN